MKEFVAAMEAANQKLRALPLKEQKLVYAKKETLEKMDDILPFLSTDPVVQQPFGYKTTWLAILTEDALSVAASFNIRGETIYETNWIKGLEGAYQNFCFVTPPVSGWVMVVNPNMYDVTQQETQNTLATLSTRFGEVCYFASHRGTAYGAFAMFKDGKLVRGFCTNDSTIALNFGEPTPVEHEIIAAHRVKHQNDPEYLDYMSETDGFSVLHQEQYILDIAENWCLNPASPGVENNASLGYLFKDFDSAVVMQVIDAKIKALKLATGKS